jgi:hypothetical protein
MIKYVEILQLNNQFLFFLKKIKLPKYSEKQLHVAWSGLHDPWSEQFEGHLICELIQSSLLHKLFGLFIILFNIVNVSIGLSFFFFFKKIILLPLF